jgi:hypothetical protein
MHSESAVCEDLLPPACQAHLREATRRPIHGLGGCGIPKMVTCPSINHDGSLLNFIDQDQPCTTSATLPKIHSQLDKCTQPLACKVLTYITNMHSLNDSKTTTRKQLTAACCVLLFNSDMASSPQWLMSKKSAIQHAAAISTKSNLYTNI